MMEDVRRGREEREGGKGGLPSFKAQQDNQAIHPAIQSRKPVTTDEEQIRPHKLVSAKPRDYRTVLEEGLTRYC